MGFSNGAIASLVAAKTGVCKQEDPCLEVLPGLYHCFDCVGIRDYQGHRMVFNSAGRKEARQLAGEFLKNHFK